MLLENEIIEYYNKIPNEKRKSKLNISPIKNFRTQPSPFLTTQRKKNNKLLSKNFKTLLSPKMIVNLKKIINIKGTQAQTPTKLNKNPNFHESKKMKKKTLILDIDETLVHSSYKPFKKPADFILNIKFNGLKKTIYVLKRPHIDEFLKELSDFFEIMTFTVSLSQYADPVLNQIDKNHIIKERLYRENCICHKGIFIKDLRKVGKDLKDVILIDNNPISYLVNIDNGLPISTWYDNSSDNELMKLVPLLKYLANVDDVRPVIRKIVNKHFNKIDFNIVNQIIKSDKNNLKRNNECSSVNNKEIDLKIIPKKINFDEYINNQDSKNSKNNKNINLNKKQENKINSQLNNITENKIEYSTINEIKSKKAKPIKKTNNNKNKIKIIKYRSQNFEKINNNKISHINNDIKNENKINIFNNNFNNNFNLTIINNYKYQNDKNFLNNNNRIDYIKLIKQTEFNNYNDNIINDNHLFFNNNYLTKTLDTNDMVNINFYTHRNFPEDNSKLNKFLNKQFHPYDSGSPRDSTSRKLNKNITVEKLIKDNYIENFIEKNKKNNILPNEVIINNVNFNNQMYINNFLAKNSTKKDYQILNSEVGNN